MFFIFRWQLGIFFVCVILSLLTHYCLYSHILHQVHVSEYQTSPFNSRNKNSNHDIDSKVDKVIERKVEQAGISRRVYDAIQSIDIGKEVKTRIDNELNDFNTHKASQIIVGKVDNAITTKIKEADIGKKVQDSLNSANIDGTIKTKIQNELDNVDIDEKVKLSLEEQAVEVVLKETDNNPQLIDAVGDKVSGKIKSDIESSLRSDLKKVLEKNDQLSNWFDKNKELIPDIDKFNDIKEKYDDLSQRFSNLLTKKDKESDSIGKLQVTITEEKDNLKAMKDEFGNLQGKLSEAVKQYEEHKKRIDGIKRELEVIQPNTFNKGTQIFMIPSFL